MSPECLDLVRSSPVSIAFLKSVAASQCGLGGSQPELLECVRAVCRDVRLANRLNCVKCGLWTFQEEMTEEFVPNRDPTDGSVVGWR